MLIIFPRCGPQRGKLIGVVGDNVEKHTLPEIRALFRVVAYNAEKLSVVKTTTCNIFSHCGPQRGRMLGVVGDNAEKHTLPKI
jgi:hypothetical protein